MSTTSSWTNSRKKRTALPNGPHREIRRRLLELLLARSDKATAGLDGLQKEAADAGLELNRMVNSLSGEKTIQNAMSMAAAVEAIGGASKLTDKELQKVARSAAEAVEKASRLGIDVPPQLQALADAQRDTSSAFDEGVSSITKFAATFVTLAAAWKLVKAGFGMVSRFSGRQCESGGGVLRDLQRRNHEARRGLEGVARLGRADHHAEPDRRASARRRHERRSRASARRS